MSKGNVHLGRSVIRTLKLAYAQFRHLPFVVVGAMTWGAAGLVLPSDVNAKVVDFVVISTPAAMVDKLLTFKGATEVFSHYPTVFENGAAIVSHDIKHIEVAVDDRIFTKSHVTGLVQGSTRWVTTTSKGSGLRQGAPAWSTHSSKSGFSHLMADGTHGIPPDFVTLGASNRDAWASVTINFHGSDVGSIDGQMLGKRVSVSWSWHELASLFNGYTL